MNLPKPLAGVRVLDFTWVRAGPWGTRWLGALGAEIVKIEWPPITTNQGRAGNGSHPKGMQRTLNTRGGFNDTNCNKVCVTLNARSAKGMEQVRRLVTLSDIVIENFSTGAMEAWGLGYQELRKLRPDIIYVSMSGFGQTGRHRDYTTMGPIAQALSGLTFLSGLPDEPPAGWGWSYMDDTGGLYGAICSITALLHRNATGKGQHVDMSQLLASIPLNGPAILDATANGRPSRRQGYPPGNRAVWPGAPLLHNYRGPITAPHNAYRTKGGGYNDWCAIACFSDEEWRRLVEVMGSPDWAQDPKLATVMGRLEHQEEMDDRIGAWAVTLEKYELMERCQAAGVRAMPVQSTQDRTDNDPELIHRKYWTEMDHPVLGPRKFQNAPFKMSETPAEIWRPGALLAQDNREVFEGLLGLDREELREGYKDGTFWPTNFSMEPYPYILEELEKPLPQDLLPVYPRDSVKADTVRATSSGPRGPLTGLRVLELADEKAQYCGKLMADLGADVIKIEPPDGEAIRGLGPFLEDTPHRDRSLSFWHYNTSKRGITLNLETEDGRRLFQRLASTADIVLESFKPGYLPSLGLGYEELKKLNPRLIMCSLTSFGQTGPWRDYIACDLVHLAAGGQMGCCGYDEGELPDAPPIAGGGGQPWHAAAHYAYIAISAALYHRDMTGRGQYIDASVHEACAITTENLITGYTYRGEIVRRQTGRHASYDETERTQFRCKDGLYMNGFLGGRLTAHRIGILAEWMDSHGLADDLTDEKYRDPAVFQENLLHINEVIINFIANLTSDELYHGSQERGLAWGKVRAPDDLIDDEHLNDRGFWVEVEHPELGRTFKYPGASAIFNAGPWRISRRAPLVGEHNEEVYCGELGLQRTELASLGEAGVT